MDYQYFLIDVFSRQKFEGAQIAVFPAADALSEQQMQLLARELNLSETVFLCAATDGNSRARLRIFTPQLELDFAGHPVIAAGFVLQDINAQSIVSEWVQLNRESLFLDAEVTAGETKIHFTLRTPGQLDNYVPSARELGEMLHLGEQDIEQTLMKPVLVNCNGEYLLVPVKSETALNEARFNINKWTTSFVATLASKIVLCCRVRPAEPVMNYRLRLLGKGIDEQDDPPVGSAAAAMGMYLFSDKEDGIYSAVLQRGGDGRRKSLIELSLTKLAGKVTSVKIGGYAVKTGSGVIYLD